MEFSEYVFFNQKRKLTKNTKYDVNLEKIFKKAGI